MYSVLVKNMEKKLGTVVRSLRLAAGMTQEALAKQLTADGIATRQNTVAKLEGGLRPTSVTEFGALARIFNYSPAQLAEAVFTEDVEETEGVKNAMLAELAVLQGDIAQRRNELAAANELVTFTRLELQAQLRRAAILESRLSGHQAGEDNGEHSEEA